MDDWLKFIYLVRQPEAFNYSSAIEYAIRMRRIYIVDLPPLFVTRVGEHSDYIVNPIIDLFSKHQIRKNRFDICSVFHGSLKSK
jgi:hypothetical protein